MMTSKADQGRGKADNSKGSKIDTSQLTDLLQYVKGYMRKIEMRQHKFDLTQAKSH